MSKYENLVHVFTLCQNRNTLKSRKSNTPSTETQIAFAHELAKELTAIGMSDVQYYAKNGFVLATLPANTTKNVRSIGFISHMDTADFSADNVQPQIVENYDGESTITLDAEGKYALNTTDFPFLKIIKAKPSSQRMAQLY